MIATPNRYSNGLISKVEPGPHLLRSPEAVNPVTPDNRNLVVKISGLRLRFSLRGLLPTSAPERCRA